MREASEERAVHVSGRSFVEQAQLRQLHARLRRFLQSVDCLTRSALHGVALASLERLRAVFERALQEGLRHIRICCQLYAHQVLHGRLFLSGSVQQ